MDLNTTILPSSSPCAFRTTLNKTSKNAYVKPPVKRSPLASNLSPMRKAKIPKVSPESEEVQYAILDALREEHVGSDAIKGILLRLGEGLRRLPYRRRAELEIEWLRQLREAELECNEIP
ncbi:PREDICTED: uncharacterized protein LOC108759256 [Trachymyrmex cornetzi]|uniref:Uncharacterized protein n=1 Tax=Trachymyrmex cornetzi TaxID=471704 RepID=A0A151JAX2_9HYME|nr:PREDICTED: uncharacterized protein LOC108759256 [Trachymyrmex cornetzi]KYN22264.1 hypothetical protein ALC57_05349 [Trachymyrmex cornetzi]